MGIAAIEMTDGRPDGSEWNAWRSLLRADASSTYFHTPEWCTAWYETFAAGAPWKSLWARDRDGELHGLLTFCRVGRRLHRRVPLSLGYWGLAGSGPGSADGLGPVADDRATGERLLSAAVELLGASIYLESLAPPWDRWAGEHGFVPTGQRRRFLLDLTADSGAGMSKKARKNLGRRRRMLTAEGVSEHWLTGPDLTDGIDTLRQLHEARWSAQGEAGLFDDRRTEYLTRLAAASTPSEGLTVLVLRAADRPIGALAGFRHGRIFHAYKTGWDPEWQRFGLGIDLHARAIERHRDTGGAWYDFMSGRGDHKATLGGVEEPTTSWLRPRGPVGALLRTREKWSARARDSSGSDQG